MKISEIIVATDLSDASSSAARWATAASSSLGVPVHYFHAVETGLGIFASSLNAALSEPKRLEEIRSKISVWAETETGQASGQISVKAGNADESLRAFIQEFDRPLLVLGKASHHGLARIALGSLTYKMAQQPLCPTVIVHPDHEKMSGSSVVVGTDLSPYSRPAVDAAVAFATAMNLDVHILHANPSPPVTVFEGTNIDVASLKAQAFVRAEAQLKELLEALANEHARLRSEVTSLYPADALLNAVETQGAQHLFLGYSHESPLMQVMLGSTSLRCLNHMKSNLILVP